MKAAIITTLAVTGILVLLLAAILPAFAAHSGIHGVTKKSSGSVLGSTKVTAEKVNFYGWTRSSSSTGAYSFNYAFGPTYLMAAMKQESSLSYKYTYDWNVSPPATKDWLLPSRSYQDVKYMLVTDQAFRTDHANHEADANTLTLAAAEPWYKEEHGILLKKALYKGDYQRVSTDCQTIVNEVATKYGIPSGTEGRFIIVGKNVDLKLSGASVAGCAVKPTGTGWYLWVVVKEITSDPGKLTMHEVGHNFGLSHVREGFGNPSTDFLSVMHKFHDDPMSIKNWSPVEDNKIETNRLWYPN